MEENEALKNLDKEMKEKFTLNHSDEGPRNDGTSKPPDENPRNEGTSKPPDKEMKDEESLNNTDAHGSQENNNNDDDEFETMTAQEYMEYVEKIVKEGLQTSEMNLAIQLEDEIKKVSEQIKKKEEILKQFQTYFEGYTKNMEGFAKFMGISTTPPTVDSRGTQVDASSINVPTTKVRASFTNVPATQIGANFINVPPTQVGARFINVPTTQVGASFINVPTTQVSASFINVPTTQVGASYINVPTFPYAIFKANPIRLEVANIERKPKIDSIYNKTNSKPGSSFNKTNPKPGSSYNKTNPKPGSSYNKTNPKPGSSFNKINPKPGPSSNKTYPKPGSSSKKTNSKPGYPFNNPFNLPIQPTCTAVKSIETIDLTDDEAKLPSPLNLFAGIVSTTHPAPLPPVNLIDSDIIPKPILKVQGGNDSIILSWDMFPSVNLKFPLISFEILGYQEPKITAPLISSNVWHHIGFVQVLELPMQCTLSRFVQGFKYHFIIRGIDAQNRHTYFSDPASIIYLPKNPKSKK